MSFREIGLNPLIVRNLEQMGYRRPRAIQSQASGPLLEGRDVIGLAPTGTGKTAAFAAPIVHHLLARPPRKVPKKPIDPASRLRALVLCPTRELAIQVAEECRHIAASTVLRVGCAYGKVGLRPQAEEIARGLDLLVATPGRVRELLEAGAMTLGYIRHVVIDEADRMFDMGFLPQVRAILETIATPRQTAVFTATMPREVERLVEQHLHHPVRVEIGEHTRPAEHVIQHLIPVENEHKVPLLLHMLGHTCEKGMLIFCATRRRVGWVGGALLRHGIKLGMIHGDRTQAQRLRALEKFEAGHNQVLVATDVAARGLHIPAVRVVVNYDMPPNAEEYVHRVGRAGHGYDPGQSGRKVPADAYTFLTGRDREQWQAIARGAGVDLKPEAIDGFAPPPLEKKKRGRKARREDWFAEIYLPSDDRPEKKPPKRSKRSKKSRPIGKDQQPGRGIVRPRSSDRDGPRDSTG